MRAVVVAELHGVEVFHGQLHQRGDQVGVVGQFQGRLPLAGRTPGAASAARRPTRPGGPAGWCRAALGRGPAWARSWPRAGSQRLEGDLLAAVGRHQDHGDVGMTTADLLHEPQAVQLGHLHVRHDDGRRVRVDGVERLAPVAGVRPRSGDPPAPGDRWRSPIDGRVVHDEHPNIDPRSGRLRVSVRGPIRDLASRGSLLWQGIERSSFRRAGGHI